MTSEEQARTKFFLVLFGAVVSIAAVQVKREIHLCYQTKFFSPYLRIIIFGEAKCSRYTPTAHAHDVLIYKRYRHYQGIRVLKRPQSTSYR